MAQLPVEKLARMPMILNLLLSVLGPPYAAQEIAADEIRAKSSQFLI